MSSDSGIVVDPAFEGAGRVAGVLVWRIEKLKVVPWPTEKHSQFYTGDAYIVLHSYKKEPTSSVLLHDLHFWLGQDSSQDEQGVAAYKSVELDESLGGAPVQYREVQGNETAAFRQLFPRLLYLKGGIDSGFNAVKPADYKPRLLQVKGKKHPQVSDVPLTAASLNDGDAFVLDAGLKLFQWNGSRCNPEEKREAGALVESLKQQRNFKPTSQLLDGLEDEPSFWSLLGGKPLSIAPATADVASTATKRKVLLRVSDASGEATMTQIATDKDGPFGPHLTPDDVYLVEANGRLWVYLGRGSSATERRKAMEFATSYMQSHQLPMNTPVTRVSEAAPPADFLAAIA